MEHSPVLNPQGPLLEANIALTSLSQRCPTSGTYPVLFTFSGLPLNLDTTAALSGGSFNYFSIPTTDLATPLPTVDPVSGLVSFPVYNTGVWQLTIVADVCLCPGGSTTGCAQTISVPVDFLIDVRDAQDNSHPPMPDYSSFLFPKQLPVGLSGEANTAPQTTPLFPTKASGYAGRNPYLEANSSFYIKIQCGDNTFFRSGYTENGVDVPAFSQTFLRVGYRDYDNSALGGYAGCDQTIVSAISFIEQSNALPPGVVVGQTVQGDGDESAAAALLDSRGYIDVTWTPQCEDRAQVLLQYFLSATCPSS